LRFLQSVFFVFIAEIDAENAESCGNLLNNSIYSLQ